MSTPPWDPRRRRNASRGSAQAPSGNASRRTRQRCAGGPKGSGVEIMGHRGAGAATRYDEPPGRSRAVAESTRSRLLATGRKAPTSEGERVHGENNDAKHKTRQFRLHLARECRRACVRNAETARAQKRTVSSARTPSYAGKMRHTPLTQRSPPRCCPAKRRIFELPSKR